MLQSFSGNLGGQSEFKESERESTESGLLADVSRETHDCFSIFVVRGGGVRVKN